MPRSSASRRAIAAAAGVVPAIAQPQPASSAAAPVTVWSGWSPNASQPAGASALSGVAPLVCPTSPAAPATAATAAELRGQLIEVYREVHDCRACPLGATRANAVFGMGNADADLMFVGEAPAAEEDRQAKPFVGRAGKLLDQLLGEIGMERKRDAWVCNVLKCKPPGNRDPQPDEIESCPPYLERQIQLIEPRVIC